MSQFQFRLQLPLRLARANRAALRRELALVMRQALEADRQRQALQQRIDDSAAGLAADAAKGASGADLALWTQRREAAHQALPALVQQIDAIAAQELAIREKLGQASRETETYERLRREAHDTWRREKERHDQALVDDAVLVRRARTATPVGEEQ